MAAGPADKIAADLTHAPAAPVVRRAVSDYMDAAGMDWHALASELGYSSESIRKFMSDRYDQIAGTDRYLRASLWSFLERHPLADDAEIPRKLLRTRDTRTILGLCEEARGKARIAVVEGPPGTSKTTALRWYMAERNRRQGFDAFYVRAIAGISGPDLLRRLCAAARAPRHSARGILLDGLVRRLKRRRPVVLLVDEAQHLLGHGAEPFEQLRDVLDLASCGCLLAGHFSFLQSLTNGLGRQLEQWLSRIDLHIHLRGLEEPEIGELWREWFSEELPRDVRDALLRFARARDRNYAARTLLLPRTAAPLGRKYLSIRRVRKFFERIDELRALPENSGQSLRALAAGAVKLLMSAEGSAL